MSNRDEDEPEVCSDDQSGTPSPPPQRPTPRERNKPSSSERNTAVPPTLMKDSGHRFRQIFENAATGIAIADLSGQLVQCNRAYCQMLGYSEAELQRIDFKTLIHPDDAAANLQLVQKLLAGEIPFFKVENRYVRKDGSAAWVIKSVSLLFDESGEATDFIALVNDITERVTLQKQIFEIVTQEHQRIGSELHDNIQQQMTGLSLLASNLSDTLAQEDSAHLPQSAHLVEAIDDLNRQVQLLARGLVPLVVDANGLQSALNELALRVTDQYKINCEAHFLGDTSVCTSMVATHLYRIAQEAINNAAKHANASHITITLEGTPTTLIMSVLNDGPPFSPDTPKTKGVGLSIVRHRAEEINATVEIIPGQNEGTLVRCVVVRDFTQTNKQPNSP